MLRQRQRERRVGLDRWVVSRPRRKVDAAGRVEGQAGRIGVVRGADQRGDWSTGWPVQAVPDQRVDQEIHLRQVRGA